jgi:hypothetical protein
MAAPLAIVINGPSQQSKQEAAHVAQTDIAEDQGQDDDSADREKNGRESRSDPSRALIVRCGIRRVRQITPWNFCVPQKFGLRLIPGPRGATPVLFGRM